MVGHAVWVSIIVNPWSRGEEWLEELRAALPTEEIHLWPECPDRDAVEFVVAWRMRRAELATFTGLRAILSLGAGAEQWQKDGTPGVDIVRLADPALSNEMAAYALYWVIRLQRHLDVIEDQQQHGLWEPVDYVPAPRFRVGILGYGTIGGRIGRAFSDLGYPVNTWSRSGTDDASVQSFQGVDELESFLGSSDAVINVLPNTEATTGLLDASRFGSFAPGAVLINIGRGTVLSSEADLIDALDNGPLRAAVLDVTEPEPPAPDSALFTHPQVYLTPHIGGKTQVRTACRLVAANIVRVQRGERPFPLVERSRGY